MILTKAVEKEIITENIANSLYGSMMDNGINLPYGTFSGYYDNLYQIDCEKFLKHNSSLKFNFSLLFSYWSHYSLHL